jgi:CHAT domain-containing protein
MTRHALRGQTAALGVALASHLLSAQSPVARPAPQEPPALAAGSVFDGSPRGQQHQRFRVELAAGDFLFAVVDQRGIDVAVTLHAPDGAALISSDSPNSAAGPERIAWIAAQPGTYELDVANLAPATQTPTGSFHLTIEAVRAATAADGEHARAERMFAEADPLVAANTPAGRSEARDKYRASAGLFAAQGRSYEQGLCLFRIGFIALRAGEPRSAIPELTQARTLFADSDPMRASVVNALGGALDLVGDPVAAMAHYREALGVFVRVGDPAREAVARNNIGSLLADTADWSSAIDQYRQAVAIFEKTGDRRRQALALYNIGVSYISLGADERSVEYLQQSREIRRGLNDRAGLADTLTQLGVAATLAGDFAPALAYFDEALPLRQAVGDRRTEGVTLTYQGRAYTASGDAPRAIEALRRAVDLRSGTGDRRGHGGALIRLAEAEALAGNVEASLSHGREAEAILRAIGDTNQVAQALITQAGAHRRLGHVDEARATAAAAMTAFESVRSRVANPETRAAYLGRHQDVYAVAIDVLMDLDRQQPGAGFAARALQVSERARARSLLDLFGESGTELRRGVDPALADRERQLARLLDAKADRLFATQAARSQGEAEALSKETQTLEAEYDEVRARIRATSPEYSALTQPQPLDVDAIRRDVLDADTTLVEYALGADASYVWVLDRQGLKTYRLAPRAKIETAAREAYELVTSRAKNLPRETPSARAQRVAASDAALPAALRRVSDLALAPITSFPTTSRLLVVADGALQYLPFEMLPAPRRAQAQPLVADFEITALPSASTLAVHRAQLARRPAPTKGVAVFADPVFDTSDIRVRTPAVASAAPAVPQAQTRLLTQTDDPAAPGFGSIARLPFTDDEAKAILVAAQGRQNLAAIGFDANKAAAVDAGLGAYRYLHFATHGFLDTARPSLSAVALSLVGRDGAAQEGFLRAHELYNLNLSADLVVLSACETGLGKEIRGEGLIGLTRAFMYAGAARVIVSLWSVSDRATASLMGRLYREMLRNGRTPSASLRAAQLALRSDSRYQHPYYWAAFTIQGDWR